MDRELFLRLRELAGGPFWYLRNADANRDFDRDPSESAAIDVSHRAP